MRLLLSSFLVVTVFGVSVVVAFRLFPEGPPSFWGIYWGGLWVILAIVATLLLNRKSRLSQNAEEDREEYIAKLESEGLLVDQTFQVVRCFQLEEFEDEGPHYYLELADGRVLYLNGQYLDETEPIYDDPEFNQPRRFPTKHFTVRRHRQSLDVIELIPGGEILEPECELPAYYKADIKAGEIPTDGQIFPVGSYEELKRKLSGSPST